MGADEVHARPRIRDLVWSARKIAGIAGLFAIVGPPVGGVTWVVIIWAVGIVELVAYGQANLEAVFKFLQMFPFIVVFAIPTSYRFGVPPAILAGVIVGTAQIRYGRLPWPVVLFIGAAVGLVFQFSMLRLLGGGSKTPIHPFSFVLSFMICIVPTFVCWGLVQNWYIDHLASERHHP
jgi:hypothetical protein